MCFQFFQRLPSTLSLVGFQNYFLIIWFRDSKPTDQHHPKTTYQKPGYGPLPYVATLAPRQLVEDFIQDHFHIYPPFPHDHLHLQPLQPQFPENFTPRRSMLETCFAHALCPPTPTPFSPTIISMCSPSAVNSLTISPEACLRLIRKRVWYTASAPHPPNLSFPPPQPPPVHARPHPVLLPSVFHPRPVSVPSRFTSVRAGPPPPSPTRTPFTPIHTQSRSPPSSINASDPHPVSLPSIFHPRLRSRPSAPSLARPRSSIHTSATPVHTRPRPISFLSILLHHHPPRPRQVLSDLAPTPPSSRLNKNPSIGIAFGKKPYSTIQLAPATVANDRGGRPCAPAASDPLGIAQRLAHAAGLATCGARHTPGPAGRRLS